MDTVYESEIKENSPRWREVKLEGVAPVVERLSLLAESQGPLPLWVRVLKGCNTETKKKKEKKTACRSAFNPFVYSPESCGNKFWFKFS